eukprot:TRINITY_DN27644_c0_g1_i1.p1 TRINITY_DN27644_c0_g1~~TRINITY_DN27644_c0_g1_i1.p1  ORF type:complete len:427 (-),score=89.84 TRINITY_DN27644_c0_g1_i1:235-1449(-)
MAFAGAPASMSMANEGNCYLALPPGLASPALDKSELLAQHLLQADAATPAHLLGMGSAMSMPPQPMFPAHLGLQRSNVPLETECRPPSTVEMASVKLHQLLLNNAYAQQLLKANGQSPGTPGTPSTRDESEDLAMQRGVYSTPPARGYSAHSAGHSGHSGHSSYEREAAPLPVKKKPAHAPASSSGNLEWGSVTTVMVRNLSSEYTQRSLLDDIYAAGFKGCFDFLYLPIDRKTMQSKGYAFINFNEPNFATHFKATFEDRDLQYPLSKKPIVKPATVQGLQANKAYFSSLRVSHGHPDSRPLFLRNDVKGQLLPEDVHPKAKNNKQQKKSTENKSVAKKVEMKSHSHETMPAQSQAPVAGAPAYVSFCDHAMQCGRCGKVAPGVDFQFCPYCGSSLQLTRCSF